MRNCIKITFYFIILILGCAEGLFAQVLVSDADFIHPSNPMDCSGQFNSGGSDNFYDTGGSLGNYSNSENEVITFCPDANGSKVYFTSDLTQSFSWGISAGDTLYIYDGPTVASPLIGAYNSFTNPNGVSFVSSSVSNLSGCLTIQFISDAADDSTGWDAQVACYTPNQPFDAHVVAQIFGEANGANDLNDDMTNKPLTSALADSGYVNVCHGDSIRLINTSSFPYEPGGTQESQYGGGYNQSDPTNHSTTWTFSDGTILMGDTVWFFPPNGIGILGMMEVIDNQGEVEYMQFKIRSSSTPLFTECRPLDEDICLGQYTELLGGITQSDTVGVDPVPTGFSAAGSFGDPLFIPDDQTSTYTTEVNIVGYPAGTTITNATDITGICVDIEHSFLGDLEMMITCPNGQSSILFNSYAGSFSGQLFPGGFGGGSVFLGGANDQSGSAGLTQGNCETYCFTELPGAMPAWTNGFSTVLSSSSSIGVMVTPGDYNPEGSFVTDLAGCPLNGVWTLTTKDNWSSDDGWICSWDITFDTIFSKPDETYTNTIVSEQWLSDPTILFGTNDTAIIVVPNTLGANEYTFQVVDNFGCTYDTTIEVNVIAGPSILPSDTTCDGSFQFSNTYVPSLGGTSGGNWFYDGPGNISFSPNNTFINPLVSADINGVYTIYFNDNVCNDTVSADITFMSKPTAQVIGDDTICQDDTVKLFTNPIESESYAWYNSSGLISTDTAALSTESGIHYLLASNYCGYDSSSIDVVIELCEVPNVITPNGDQINDAFYTRYADVYSDVNLIIYNRWGRVVYKTDSYDNSWQGEKTNGNSLHEGVYFYVMSWDNGSKSEAGNITVFVE